MSDIHLSEVKILIIDDEPFTRRLINQLLRQLEVRYIVEAADGKSGYMELARHHPDIVLCDINMEPVDGFKFLGTLRKTSMKSIAETPVIFLTADMAQESVVRAASLAVNGYLVKPVSVKELRQRIVAVLCRSRQYDGG